MLHSGTRPELSPADRAKQTARRKAIYLELHPETAAGISQAAGMNEAQRRGAQLEHDVDRFDVATAKVTGQSSATVRRDAERGEKVIEAPSWRLAPAFPGISIERGNVFLFGRTGFAAPPATCTAVSGDAKLGSKPPAGSQA